VGRLCRHGEGEKKKKKEAYIHIERQRRQSRRRQQGGEGRAAGTAKRHTGMVGGRCGSAAVGSRRRAA